MSGLEVGLLVELHSLSRADLNGQRGFILSWDAAKERWGVQCGEALLNVRPTNLQAVPPPRDDDAEKAQEKAYEAAGLLGQARATNRAAEKKRLLAEATAALDAAANLDMGFADIHQLRGDMAHMAGDHARMVLHMRRAVANTRGGNEESARARMGLANALGETGDDAGEEEQVRQVLKTFPGHIHARFSLGQCLSRSGRYDEAIHEFMMAVQLPNEEPRLAEQMVVGLRGAARSSLCNELGRRGMTQQRRRDHEAAVASFGRLLEVPGIDADMRARTEANLATSLAHLGRLAEAAEAARRGVTADAPTAVVNAHAINTAAGVEEAMGDAVATGGRDPGADAAARYEEAKKLYKAAHHTCADKASRIGHVRVQAKAHTGLEWISNDVVSSQGSHCGGHAFSVAPGVSIEQL